MGSETWWRVSHRCLDGHTYTVPGRRAETPCPLAPRLREVGAGGCFCRRASSARQPTPASLRRHPGYLLPPRYPKGRLGAWQTLSLLPVDVTHLGDGAPWRSVARFPRALPRSLEDSRLTGDRVHHHSPEAFLGSSLSERYMF